jgi:internalin A
MGTKRNISERLGRLDDTWKTLLQVNLLLNSKGHPLKMGVSPFDLYRSLSGSELASREFTSEDINKLELLTKISVADNPVKTLEPLQLLPNIEYLDASFCGLKNIEGIESNKKITELYLENNALTDIKPLAGLENIRTLILRSNLIYDLSSLDALKSLQLLDIGHNQIESIEELGKLDQLQELQLDSNFISDGSSLGTLKSLQVLLIGNNKVTDIRFITKLQHLVHLDITGLSVNNLPIDFIKKKKIELVR